MSATKNLYLIFLQTAGRLPNQMACRDLGANIDYSYADLAHRIADAAGALKQAGISSGDCVGLHIASGLDYIIFAYAIWACGGVVVPIATEIVDDERSEIFRKIRIDAVMTTTRTSGLFDEVAGEGHLIAGGIIVRPVRSPLVHPAGFLDVDAAFIRFTSGTTATAKGVVLSHATVHDRIHAANDALAINAADTVIWLLSMSYHFTVSIVSYLTFGATIILCSDHFGETIVEEAAANGATLIYGSPQHYSYMLADKTATRLADLRLAISTASSLKSEIATGFFKRFGVALSQAYGLIEVGLPCINLLGETAKPGSVGRLLPAYRLRMRDVPESELKAIDLAGPGIVDAYYNPWLSRDEIMPEGWFETGDMGFLDEDGYLIIAGRSKEMISVGGMKFFPRDVETVLESHPAIAEAYVYSEPSSRLGEIPRASVRLRPGVTVDPAELRHYCLARLSSYKVPQQIDVVAELPKTASGKLRRRSINPA